MNATSPVYYNDKPIIVCNDPETYVAENTEAATYKRYASLSSVNPHELFQYLDDSTTTGIIVAEDQPEAAVNKFVNIFRILTAGGGLVFNSNNDLLMIFRRGKWDLPKGKQDEGERIEECTLREISEETGLKELELLDKVCETRHIYQEKGDHLVKHTHWFRVRSTANENIVVQEEEDITEAAWVNEGRIQPFAGNTYRAVKDVLKAAGLSW